MAWIRRAGIIACLMAGPAAAQSLQSRDDAWWTGPIAAAGASTLPQGHLLAEPYLFDSIPYGAFDKSGALHGAKGVQTPGASTFFVYGLVDDFSVGMIPYVHERRGQFGLGDMTLQGQLALTRYTDENPIPTSSLVVIETLPVGKFDALGPHRAGFGGGAYSTTVAIYSQTYFWMPNGRILRARLDVGYTWSEKVRLEDVSVYGTTQGFRGLARPGSSAAYDLSGEYSITREWVAAADVIWENDANTRITSSRGDGARFDLGSARALALIPAVEYNWSPYSGVIVGTKLVVAGRNVAATVTPVAAVNLVF